MWLIDAKTFQLVYFLQCPTGQYAILSHVWGKEELSFDEFRNDGGQNKVGFEKIKLCCEQALDDGLEYAWVDTVCIDKRSSTELSEAINSMFEWYRQAKVCYAYLADVNFEVPQSSSEQEPLSTALAHSRWFSRGWTLQELIAPEVLIFYSVEWNEIGSKKTLAESLKPITRIDADVLDGYKSFRDCSIAQRMSWAAKRTTTRIEDMAYSLIGLFNINLPLMYGEGLKAFIRLQQRIIEESDDESIFAWTGVPQQGSGLLAPSVSHFRESAGIERLIGDPGYIRPPYVTTNRGISIELIMLPFRMNVYAVGLWCMDTNLAQDSRVIIFITPIKNTKNSYRRILCQGSATGTSHAWGYGASQVRNVFIPIEGCAIDSDSIGGLPVLRITSDSEVQAVRDSRALNPIRLSPNVGSSSHARESYGDNVHLGIQFRQQELETGVSYIFKLSADSGPWYSGYLQFGFDFDFNPVCLLSTEKLRLNRTTESTLGRMTMIKEWFRSSSQPLINVKSFWVPRSEWKVEAFFADHPWSRIDMTPKQLVSSYLRRSVGRGRSDTDIAAHRIDVISTFKTCTQVEAFARPVSDTMWDLKLFESSRHKGFGTSPQLCLWCILGDLCSILCCKLYQRYVFLAFSCLFIWLGTGFGLGQFLQWNSHTFVLTIVIIYSSFGLSSILLSHVSIIKIRHEAIEPRKRMLFEIGDYWHYRNL